MKLEGIVLAGGLGTRLRDTVPGLPKPMAPIAGRPFLSCLLDYLGAEGFDHIVLSIGHLGTIISDYFGDRYRNIDISYALESSPLGTGGATLGAMGQCRENPFFVINGDTFLAHDYKAMHARHMAARANFSMAIRDVEDVSRYGRVVLEGDTPVRLEEKSAAGPGWVNAGVYLFDRSFFAGLHFDGPCSLERDIIAPGLSRANSRAFATSGYFIDIGVPADYQRAQVELANPVQAGHTDTSGIPHPAA